MKSISAELPAAVAKSGKLVIGVGALPAGFPPLGLRRRRPEDPHRLRARPRPPGRRGPRAQARGEELHLGEPLRRHRQRQGRRRPSPTSPTPRSARRSTSSPPTGRTTSPSWCRRRAPGTSTATTRTSPARRSPSAPAPTRRRSSWSGRTKLAKRGQEAHRQVLPGQPQHLPRAEQREDRRLLRPQPRLRLPRPSRWPSTPNADPHRGHVLRRRRDPAGPDRGHGEEGQRPRQAARRRHQLPDQERSVRQVARRHGTSPTRPSPSPRSTRPDCRSTTPDPPCRQGTPHRPTVESPRAGHPRAAPRRPPHHVRHHPRRQLLAHPGQPRLGRAHRPARPLRRTRRARRPIPRRRSPLPRRLRRGRPARLGRPRRPRRPRPHRLGARASPRRRSAGRSSEPAMASSSWTPACAPSPTPKPYGLAPTTCPRSWTWSPAPNRAPICPVPSRWAPTSASATAVA